MLPQEIVKQVRRIQFQTGRHVADVLAGQYLSIFKGQGMEFEEVRPYEPGDDVRNIDWNVTARTGAPFVKRYAEERELTVLLLVDISASQDFGSQGRAKREAAAELSALLAFSAIHNNDKVGLLLFHGDTEAYIPPRKGQRHALRVIREVLAHGQAGLPESERELGSFAWRKLPAQVRLWLRGLSAQRKAEPRRSTQIARALEFTRKVLPRRAVLFLISDFLDADFMAQGHVRALRAVGRRHELVAVLVTDEREGKLLPAGLVTLEDAETGERLLVDTSDAMLRDRLGEEAEARQRALKSALRGAGVDLLRIDATRSVVDPLLAFFRMRQRRRRGPR